MKSNHAPANLFKRYCLIFLLSISGNLLLAQSQPATIKGKTIDSLSSDPLSAVSIRLFAAGQKKQVMGIITSEDGDFSSPLSFGRYYAIIERTGYTNVTVAGFSLSRENPVYDFGIIRLVQSATILGEVVVESEKSFMKLELDRRIFTVGKDLANAGGSASDILTNIPSVTVDGEGNVKLRGSDNVRILIDGKPSGLVSFKGSAGLQQLPASLIDRVEIITNPSARYEAEGNAGIINIILKKDKRQGFNGSLELITGYYPNYGAAANLNYRHKKINFFINYGIAYRNLPGRGNLYQEVYGPDTIFISKQSTRNRINGLNTNIQGGLDYYFTEKSILTASYLFKRSDATRISDIHYEDFFFDLSHYQGLTTRNQHEKEKEPNSEYTLNYKRTFEKKDHELSATVKYIDNWESSNQVFTQYSFDPSGIQDPSKSVLQKSPNDEYEKQWLFQVDYIQPLGKEGKLETGIRSSFRDMINDFLVTEKNTAGDYLPLPGLDNVFVYKENIHAAYGIIANKIKKISYQAGLRAEWTDVKTVLQKTNDENPRNYVNFFPSAHFTYQVTDNNALQLSYSRRVRRPFYNDLSPYMTYSDSRNFYSGNPDLNPEFSNVGEVAYIMNFSKGSLFSGLYYRNTKGKIDRIRRVDDEGKSTTLPENLNRENAWGAEFTGAWTPVYWWKLDMNVNLFHSAIDGSNILALYKTSAFSWFARQTSRFTLPHNIEMQARGNYEAAQKTAQGKRRAVYFVDLSMNKDVLKGNGTISLNVLDVFNSRRNRYISNGLNFITEGNSQFRRRQINLTFNYRIKQSKPPAKKEVEE
jgi:outer membrane receptor protein involved in Fe transport